MKKISFIVPVYNVENYLEESIESILNISYDSKEIILINDGSTDNSKKICERYEDTYDNIFLINQKNKGVSIARNVGIQKAIGEYLFFVDSDDYYAYDFSDDIKDPINKTDSDIILFDYLLYYDKSKKKEAITKNFNREDIFKKTGKEALEIILEKNPNFPWFIWPAAYRREFLIKEKIFFKKNRRYEDVLWLPEVFLKAFRIDYVNKHFYTYRLERDGQVTSVRSENLFMDNIYAVNYWEKKCEKYHLNIELKEMLMSNIANGYFYTIMYFHYLKNQEERKMIASEIKKNKKYLDYTSSIQTKVTSVLYRIFGLRITSKSLYILFNFKEKIRSIILRRK